MSNQRALLKKFTIDNSLVIHDEYIDDGISGTTFDRPAFKKMLQDIELKKINMVITKDLSRLGRDYIGTGHYLEKYFPEKRVRYISLLDGIDTGVDSSLNDITPFKAVLNDLYAKDISSKIKSVKHNKQEQGLFIGGKAPYGYMLKKDSPNRLFVDEVAKVIVERIFNEAVAGKSLRAIARDLNKDGILTPSMYAISYGQKVSKVGQNWSDSRIREILLNEVYIGNMVQGRMKKINYKSKKNIRLPKSEWKIVEKTHDAIISKEVFYKAGEMIKLREKTRVRTNDYLLKGLVVCKECKSKMTCFSVCSASQKKYYFRCSTYVKDKNKCTSHLISKDVMEQIVCSKVKEVIVQYLDEEKLINIAVDIVDNFINKNKGKWNENEIYINLEKITREIDSLYNDKLSKIISEEDFRRIYNNKKKEQEKLNRELLFFNQSKKISKQHIQDWVYDFKNELVINRENLVCMLKKIEIDTSKKIAIYFLP